MKKIISFLLAFMMLTGILAGCSSGPTEDTSAANANNALQIVTTTFPIYDWVREIVGEQTEGVELTLLLKEGVDLHSYQPTVEDISKISACDVFIYIGGESDAWSEGVLETAVNKDIVAINLLDVLGDAVKEEELVEGMERDHDEDGQDSEEDEHIWLSLKNARVICSYISGVLAQLDSAHADVYTKNTAAYTEKLTALDDLYQKTVDEAQTKTLLFADRFPFRYLMDDYNLAYYAAFAGCSAETEASFETIAFLANKVDELHLQCVMTIEGSDESIASTVVQNTADKDQKILVLDSLQAVTAEDTALGTTYLSVMESNLEVLKEALA